MKKIIFLSILFAVLSCKKSENERLQNLPKKEYVPQTIEKEKIEVPSYKIMEEKDISFRTGYNTSDPINKRFTYRVLVSPKIKRNQIEPLFNKLIKEITAKDEDIDDITIWLFSDKNLVYGVYNVGMATWAPADGNVTSEIAVTNNRSSYKLNVTIPDDLEQNLNPVEIDSVSGKIDGELIGKWKEFKYSFSNFIIYKKKNKFFLKTIEKDGKTFTDELKQRKCSKGIRYDYKNGNYGGDYFILNKDNELGFYNMLNEKFSTGLPK